MAVIDYESLAIEEVRATDQEVYDHLDRRSRELFHMSAAEFILAVKEGRPVDHPAAARLGLLAEAFI